ncbi:MAG: hypothetical protein J6Y94_01290 [Bacteriovoracaceae bacterium]|nr:hypothetical protein [Bacteriovoracaceae bacterium]
MKTKPLPQVNSRPYAKFSLIDGRHPLQNAVPDAFVAYPARTRHGGKLAFLILPWPKRWALSRPSIPSN